MLDDSLDRREMAALIDALLDAFPTSASLQKMVRLELGASLPGITPPGPLEDVVFHLVEWAMAQAQTRALVEGAHRVNPRNTRLRTFVQSYRASRAPAGNSGPAAAPAAGVDRAALLTLLLRIPAL